MREDRRIIFNYDELYKALFTLCMAKEIKRPETGRVHSIIAKEEEPHMIVMQVKSLDELHLFHEEYTHDFVAAALLAYCRGIGVPIPRKARKSILLAPDSVTMRIEK